MPPENRLCMLLSVEFGLDHVSLLRNALAALAATPKFAALIFVAADYITCNTFDRAQLVPMRR
jgi:hypothetical protein